MKVIAFIDEPRTEAQRRLRSWEPHIDWVICPNARTMHHVITRYKPDLVLAMGHQASRWLDIVWEARTHRYHRIHIDPYCPPHRFTELRTQLDFHLNALGGGAAK